MADQRRAWADCGHDECIGVQLPTTNLCLSHTAEQNPIAFQAELQRIGEEGTVDARGVDISFGLLQQVLAAAPREDGRPAFKAARFDQASFRSRAGFGQVTFRGAAEFGQATFEGAASFRDAAFQDGAIFDGAAFKGGASFRSVTFEGAARFGKATFEGIAAFHGTTFKDTVFFGRATFKSRVGFGEATFEDLASFGEATFEGSTGFREAIFEDTARFSGATFQRGAGFSKATFKDRTEFRDAIFNEGVLFDRVVFKGRASFSLGVFEGRANFRGVNFEDEVGFIRASFHGQADFMAATFGRSAWFREATFEGSVVFTRATFGRQATFGRVTFKDSVRFGGVTFGREAIFARATFETAGQFGPVLVGRQLSFDSAVFRERVQIEAAAATLCAGKARFLAGVQLRVRWAQIVLDDADLAEPSILVGVPPFAGLNEDRFARLWRRLPPAEGRDGRPRLLSVRRADVAGLTVADADLRSCRFVGAHNLDQLRTEGNAKFGNTPRSWWWTTRLTIAEEHHWRSCRMASSSRLSKQRVHRSVRHRGWYPSHHQPPHWLSVEAVTPAQLAGLYRALRKGREDNKDEPGAADFYYGETEMRRQARHNQAQQERQDHHWGPWASARVEHAILWLYWLVSGYGLRAWRALTAVAAVLVLFAVLCVYGGGFATQVPQTTAIAGPTVTTTSQLAPTPTTQAVPPNRPAVTATSQPTSRTTTQGTPSNSTAVPTTTATADTSFGGAIVYGARTVIGLTRLPQPQLTLWGDVLQILLRIIAPVLLGLAILSVRGRVKR